MIVSDRELILRGLKSAMSDTINIINDEHKMFNSYRELYNAMELKKALDLFIELKIRQETEYPENDEIPF